MRGVKNDRQNDDSDDDGGGATTLNLMMIIKTLELKHDCKRTSVL